MTDLKTLSTTSLIARLHAVEAQGRWARDLQALQLYADRKRIAAELDSRPTCEVLAALS